MNDGYIDNKPAELTSRSMMLWGQVTHMWLAQKKKQKQTKPNIIILVLLLLEFF